MKPKYPAPPNRNQKDMIKRRGLDPEDYLVLKDTFASLYLKDLRNGRVKIIYKQN